MDDLNPKARALVEAGREAFRASSGDQARIEAMLRARLGAGALPPEASVARVAGAVGARAAARFLVGAVFVLGVGVSFVALWPSAESPAQRAVRATPAPVVLVPGAPPDAGVRAATALEGTDTRARLEQKPGPIGSSPSAALPSVRQAPDQLAREVALLERATAELRAGRAETALRLLAKHQNRFPNGLLGEDRRTAKAQALCLLGHIAEGRAELALLPPASIAAARARQACEAGALEKDSD